MSRKKYYFIGLFFVVIFAIVYALYTKREEILMSVIQKKIEIKTKQDQDLQEQIQKTYKNDPNYFIRDINYNQVESTSPSFSMKGKYEIGSIFQYDKHDKETEFPSSNKKINQLENPNFSLIRPRYPAFSFGTSQRFNSISIDGRNSRTKNVLNKKAKFYIINPTSGELAQLAQSIGFASRGSGVRAPYSPSNS